MYILDNDCAIVVKLLPLQGVGVGIVCYPGRCPGLCGSAPSGRATYFLLQEAKLSGSGF